MQCGISTACFFPEETLEGLKAVAACGAQVTEIFLNTFGELEDSYIGKLQDVANASALHVSALHPFSSSMEGFFFATAYGGRLEDGIKLYRRLFEAARALRADKLVFHGDNRMNVQRFTNEQYARNFRVLSAIGKEYGVVLCQENVTYCRVASPKLVEEIRPLLGDAAAFVLDTKQAQRFGTCAQDMLVAMGRDVKHIHISDFTQEDDCLPPGRGEFAFRPFVKALQQQGYAGDLIIELYRDGFARVEDLTKAMRYVQGLLPVR